MSLPKLKYYKHYKNKPYRYIGTAKHSEELIDYVIYECLYPNELSTLWIRPQSMFHENIHAEGKSQPRFKISDYTIETYDHVSESLEKELYPLCEKTFPLFNIEKFKSRMKDKNKIKIFCLYIDSELAGFKIGYEKNIKTHYSWLGAVQEKYRRLGIAQTLMQTQHTWAKEHKYKYVETKSENKFKDMMILNLRSGFEIVGTESSPSHQTKILFRKQL